MSHLSPYMESCSGVQQEGTGHRFPDKQFDVHILFCIVSHTKNLYFRVPMRINLPNYYIYIYMWKFLFIEPTKCTTVSRFFLELHIVAIHAH